MLKLNKENFALSTINEKFDLGGDYEIYLCGSRRYGTHHPESDTDYIVINNKIDQKIKIDPVHLIFMKRETWQLALRNHRLFEIDAKLYRSVVQTFYDEIGRAFFYLAVDNEHAARKNMTYAWKATYLGTYLTQFPTLNYGTHLKDCWKEIVFSGKDLLECKKKCFDALKEYKNFYKRVTCIF